MRLRAVLTATALALACGPAAPSSKPVACVKDSDCKDNGDSCVAGTCVPPAPAAPSNWQVEITPQPGSAAAVTEVPFPGPGAIVINTFAPASVTVNLKYPANISPPANADIVLTVPAVIPGRPDRTFTAPLLWAPNMARVLPTEVDGIPGPSLTPSSTASVTVAPLPPDDATSPPRTLPLTLAANVDVSIPSPDHSIGGRLLEADSSVPANPFAARAFVAGTSIAVSNRGGLRSNDGGFALVVPEAAAAMPLAVEIVPTGGGDPTFTSSLLMLPSGSTSADLGSIVLAPYTSPNQFGVTVQDESQAPITGAFVTATTILSQTPGVGTTSFLGGAVSGNGGVASLALLPGTTNAKLSYEIAVVPPGGSASASNCWMGQMVGTGGAAVAPAMLATVQLPHRRVLSGTVRVAGGAGVAGVLVSATPGPGPIPGCTRTRPAPGNTTTDVDGQYALPLDPGSYQLDYDPPPGSPYPRVTNPNGALTITAAADPTGGDVTLPTAGVVLGQVNEPDRATPLAGATVSIYEPQCSGGNCTAPLLVGQAQTDGGGGFRIVVASP
jgi:hypothetical protein